MGFKAGHNLQSISTLGQRFCSDPNNESDPSSEYSLLGLTHVMNHCLGQKFIIWVKINCLDMSLKPGTGIPRPRTAHESLYMLLEMQHTQMAFHAFKMADKIARKEGHRQVFVEYVNEIADNSRLLLFVFTKTSQKLVTTQSPEILKKSLLTNWPPIIALGLSFTRMSVF